MPKKYEMSFELNGQIDPRLTRTFDNLSKDVSGLEKDLGMLGKSKGFDRLTRDAAEAGGAFHELRENAKEFGEIFSRVGQYTGAHAIIEKITGSIGEMVSTIGELDAQSGQLAAATGATAEELEGLQDISQSLYRQGLGEGVNDLTDALVVARNVTKLQGDELERTAKNAIVLQDVFQFDIPESVKASDTMMRQFGITSEESMNLLAQGAQRGLDKSGELLDSANEYAPQFAALGYSANEMFDIFAAGMDAGAWNLDKVGDLAKEFNIRIQDGSAKTADALGALFAPEKIEEFTLALTKGGTKSAEYMELLKHVSADTAKQMVKDLQKGGKGSEDVFKALSSMLGDGNKILSDLSTGAVKGKDVMQRVITELSNIDDQVYRNMLGVELFGTQWEDLEKEVVSALGSTQSQFDMTTATMEEMAEVKYDNLTQDLKVLGRELMDEVIVPIGEDLMPVLKDMTAWAKDNKDVIKAIGLAVPAAMLAKNSVGMVKDVTSVGKALFDTTNGVSKFGKFAGLLTNPVGLAVGAVGALTLGVIAYKKHQDLARQALINMGDKLEETSKQYEAAADKAKKTNDLVWTYNNLSDAIKNSSGNSHDLVIQKEKLAEVTEKLQELYPETITQYDIENDKVKEKVGLLKQESDAELELAKLRLEKEAAEGQKKLPKLEDEIQSLEKQTADLQEQKQALDTALPALKEYQAEFQKIMQADDSEDRSAKLEALRQKADEVGETVGFVFDSINHLDFLDGNIEDLTNERISTLDTYIAKMEELGTAKNSYEDLYQAQLNLIELDYGADLEEQASKYTTLSQKEQERFQRAMQDVSALHQEMDILPTEKQINVDVLWNEIGSPMNMLKPKGFNMPMFADGGLADGPSIFGEDGLEMAIPIKKDKRSRDLHAMTGQMLGVDSGSSGGGGDFIYSPQYNIQGNADVEAIKEMDNRNRADFKQQFDAYKRERQRVSLA
ncbi:phage tail tape measure protein [Paenibacillus lautus]|uniref:phage tail tape measure protein n=1 Tax=Paenibacillus lautus TaxID=1401 RepID=UPI003D2D9EC2